MKVMVIVKAGRAAEAGELPGNGWPAEMGRFNEALAKAGILPACEELHPSSRGARVRFEGRRRTVIDGPFAGTQELVAGFWLWQVRNLDETIEWTKRAPFGGGGEIESRPVSGAGDSGDAPTSGLRGQEARLAAQARARARAPR